MLKLLKILFRTGAPTVKYPFAPLEVCAGFRGKPQLTPEQCIACGACTNACPANALTLETFVAENKRVWQLFLGRCIYCGRCEEVCPTRAIRLTEEFELAVSQKADLYTRATFRLQPCRRCGLPFAPEKSVALAAALLIQSQQTPQLADSLREQLNLCPACRRREALEHHGVDIHYFLEKQA